MRIDTQRLLWGRCVAAAGALVLMAWLSLPASASAAYSVYVVNTLGNSVSQYDVLPGGGLSPKFPTSVPSGGSPFGIAVGADGTSVYVANGDDGTISQYDIGQGGVLSPKTPATIALGAGTHPSALAVSPDDKNLYALGTSLFQLSIGPAGLLSLKTPASVPLGNAGGNDIIVSPDGKSVYVSAGSGPSTQHMVLQFDVGPDGTLTPKSPATVASADTLPGDMAMTPDGKSLYLTHAGLDSTSLEEFDVLAGGVLQAKAPGSVNVGKFTASIAVSPDGKSAYAQSQQKLLEYDIGAGGVLSPKSTASLTTAAGGLVLTADGRYAYGVDSGFPTGNVFQFDVGTGGLLSPQTPTSLPAGPQPDVVAITPNAGPLAAFAATAGVAGAVTSFNGSGSSDSDGSVGHYAWDFGDGSTLADGGPTPTHTYSAPGTYTVTLTVTDDTGCSLSGPYTGTELFCTWDPSARAAHTVVVPEPAPVISSLKETQSRFAAARTSTPLTGQTAAAKHPRGTVFSFGLNWAATVKIGIERKAPGRRKGHGCRPPSRSLRHHPRCTRTVMTATLVRAAHAGANSVPFTGRIKGKALKPGHYVAVFTASNSGGTSAGDALTFTIVPR